MYKQVLIIRKDLNMRKGKMIAQGAHASLTAVLKPAKEYAEWISDWLYGSMTKIVVSVNSEEELKSIYNTARDKMPSCLITDKGNTEFHGIPTITAVAIGPAPVDMIDKITRHLSLL